VVDLDDPALKERIAGLKVIRDQAKVDAERMLDHSGHKAISPAMIRFPRPPAIASGSKRAAIIGTTCARSPSALRSPTTKSVSWDRRMTC
jgi:hypothetical protein